MLFHNPTKQALRFKIGSLAYDVPAGADCDIPPNVAYVVADRGLPLVEGPGGGERIEASVPAPVIKRMPPGIMTGEADTELPFDDSDDDEATVVSETVEKLKSQGASFKSKPKGRSK